jgi:hypothetical protein
LEGVPRGHEQNRCRLLRLRRWPRLYSRAQHRSRRRAAGGIRLRFNQLRQRSDQRIVDAESPNEVAGSLPTRTADFYKSSALKWSREHDGLVAISAAGILNTVALEAEGTGVHEGKILPEIALMIHALVIRLMVI